MNETIVLVGGGLVLVSMGIVLRYAIALLLYTFRNVYRLESEFDNVTRRRYTGNGRQ